MTEVVAGERPNVEEIEGPEHMVEFVRSCVQTCWNEETEQLPTFSGEILTSVGPIQYLCHS